MAITTQRLGSVDIVMPDGPLTDHHVGELRDILTPLVAGVHPRLVLFMVEVPYVDSEGAEMLLDLAETLRRQSLGLKIAGLSPTCREIFNLAGLLREFDLFDDIQDAVRSYG